MKKRLPALEASNLPVGSKRPPEEIEQRWRRLARLRNRLGVCFIGGEICGLTLVYLMLHMSSRPPLFLAVWCAFMASSVFGLGGGWLALRCQTRLVKHVRQTLESREIRSLSCWIDLLFATGAQACNNGEWEHHRAAARAGLVEYLPLLTEETTSLLLSATDRRALYKALKGQEKELITAVLQVVPLLGDAYALPYVQHLAEGKGAARTVPELQAEAQAILPRLQARLALSSSTAVLLRASQPPQQPQKELLVPAQAPNETPPDELLRAENRK